MEDRIEAQIFEEEYDDDFEFKDDEVYIIIDKDEYQIIVDDMFNFYILDKSLNVIPCSIDCDADTNTISSSIVYSEELKNIILNYDYNKVNKFLYDNKDEILEALSSILNKINNFNLEDLFNAVDNEDEDDE